MTTAPSVAYTFVDDRARFLELCHELERADRIAVDTEADSMHHYPERVCLVQVATPRTTWLLDSLALGDLSPLAPVLARRGSLKLLHGADYDIRGLNRDWGLTVANLFDTHVAARFLGLERVGLAALLQELLDIEIPKDRKIQRADWSKRPLDDEALRYAAADVCHLFALHDVMAGRLRKLGRLAWVEEECERLSEVRHTPQDLRATVLALPESRKMDSRQRAVLLALYRWRDGEARRVDRPPSRVLPPAALAEIAADPNARLEEHVAEPQAGEAFRQGHTRGGRRGAERPAAGASRADVAGAGQADAGPDQETGGAEGVEAVAGEGARHGGGAGVADAQPGAPRPRATVLRRGAALARGAGVAAGAVWGGAAAGRQRLEARGLWRQLLAQVRDELVVREVHVLEHHLADAHLRKLPQPLDRASSVPPTIIPRSLAAATTSSTVVPRTLRMKLR